MKKGSIVIIFGLVFILLGFIEFSDSNIPFDIDRFVKSKTIFIDYHDNYFSFIYFEKENDDYVLNVKRREYSKSDCFLNEANHGLRLKVTIKDNMMESTEKNIKLSYQNNRFTLIGSKDLTIFNGKYIYTKNINKDYSLPSYENSYAGGLYTSDEKEVAKFYICNYDDKTYDITGTVKNNDDYYIFGEFRIDKETNILTDKNNNYYFTFGQNSLEIYTKSLSMNEKIDNVLNGKYKKITKVSYKSLMDDLNKSVKFESNTYGVY